MRRTIVTAAAVLAALALAGCGTTSARAPRASEPTATAVPVPALNRVQSLEACAGIHVGFLTHHPESAYISEVRIAWNELRTVTGRQADQAVINAAVAYCPQYVLQPLPSYDLPP